MNTEQTDNVRLITTVYAKLWDQGKPSINPETGDCRYRSDDGSKCAIGHVLDDEVYSFELEGVGIITILTPGTGPDLERAGERLREKFPSVHSSLFCDMQAIHDLLAVRQLTGMKFRSELREGILGARHVAITRIELAQIRAFVESYQGEVK
jgi:hypothetical protein